MPVSDNRAIDNLTGRTGADDDGRVFEILAEARATEFLLS